MFDPGVRIMSKAYSLDKDGLDHRLTILGELARSIETEIDDIVGAENGIQIDNKDEPVINLEEQVRKFEIDLIRFALFRSGGHQTRAAKRLGVNISTLNEKIRRYGISTLGFRSSRFNNADGSNG